MKLVTVTTCSNEPKTFLSSKVDDIFNIEEYDTHNSDWDVIDKRLFIRLVFYVHLTTGEEIQVCGNVEEFADVCNNGGVLPSKYYDYRKLSRELGF